MYIEKRSLFSPGKLESDRTSYPIKGGKNMIPGSQPSATVGDCFVRSYRDRLSPWCIVQLLPKMQRRVVKRFRRRNDATEHLRVLQRLNPSGCYELVFDPAIENSDF
ncbi:hypothetical protein [Phormidesmis priestleyi]